MAKNRWLYFPTTGNVAYATFTVKRSGCASAELYPRNRKFMVARVLLICYSYFKTSCGNGHKLTKKQLDLYLNFAVWLSKEWGPPQFRLNIWKW